MWVSSPAPTLATRWLTAGALSLAPGLAVIYLGFNAGGFFPNTQGVVATVVLVILAAWIAFADDAFGGLGGVLAVATGALAAFSAWIMLSAIWSDSTSRALLETNRALLYLGTLVLFGLIYRGPGLVGELCRGLLASSVRSGA